MAKKAARKSRGKNKKASGSKKSQGLIARMRRWGLRIVLGIAVAFFALILVYSVVNPPITHTIWSEWRRLGKIDRDWVAIEEISPVMARSAVAAEDGIQRADVINQQLFDRATLGEPDVCLLPVGATTARHTEALVLALDVDDLDVRDLDLEQEFDGLLDLGLVGVGANLEYDLIVGVPYPCALFGHMRGQQDFE